jgi:hypothetical protein
MVYQELTKMFFTDFSVEEDFKLKVDKAHLGQATNMPKKLATIVVANLVVLNHFVTYNKWGKRQFVYNTTIYGCIFG